MFRWIIIEGQQRIPVLDQLGRRFVPFHAIGFDKEVEGDVGFSFGFSLLDVVEVAFGFRLHGLRHRPLVARTMYGWRPRGKGETVKSGIWSGAAMYTASAMQRCCAP